MLEKTRQARNTLRAKGFNPKLVNCLNGELLEVNLNNFILLYDPINKRWRKRNEPSLWVKCKSVPGFINQAKKFLVKKKKIRAKRIIKPTENQQAYMDSLCSQLNIDYVKCNTKSEAIAVIDELVKRKKNKEELRSIDASPSAPRKYKGLSIQFNRYEFNRLGEAVAASGMGVNEFVREALVEAELKMQAKLENSNPFDPNESRTQLVNGKVKPFKTIGLQFNRYEWWELEQAVKKSKRTTNSIIREGFLREVEAVGVETLRQQKSARLSDE